MFLAQAVEEEVLPPPCMDLTGFPLKTDIFEGNCSKSGSWLTTYLLILGMHMLPGENVEKLDGAPNFRQVRASIGGASFK